MDIRVEIETTEYFDEEPLILSVRKESIGLVIDTDFTVLDQTIETIFQVLLATGYSESTLNRYIDKEGQIETLS